VAAAAPSAAAPPSTDAAPAASDANAAPHTNCAPVNLSPPSASTNPSYSLDFRSGDLAGVTWVRPLGERPWFSSVTPQGGLILGDRNISYRNTDGLALSVGNLTPFSTAWGDTAPIGGFAVSNLSTAADATVPEGKIGYSSVWGRLNDTDPTATQGDIDYGASAGTSSLRYGLTPDLTLESQMQSAPSLSTTGLGTTYSVGQWGTVQAGGSQSRFDTGAGWRYRLGYSVGVFDFLKLGYANEQTGAGYNDLSTYQTGPITERQSRNTLTAGVPTGSWGTLSGTYSGVRDADGMMSERLFGLSQTMTVAPGINVSLGADHDVISGDYSVNMQLSMPVGGR
jgi:hypothetical protein